MHELCKVKEPQLLTALTTIAVKMEEEREIDAAEGVNDKAIRLC
jgi:hypothetical protein